MRPSMRERVRERESNEGLKNGTLVDESHCSNFLSIQPGNQDLDQERMLPDKVIMRLSALLIAIFS